MKVGAGRGNNPNLGVRRKRREQNTCSYTRPQPQGKTSWETFIFFSNDYLIPCDTCVYGNPPYLEDSEVRKAAVAMEQAVFAFLFYCTISNYRDLDKIMHS